MTAVEAISSILIALFMSGGPVVAYINQKAKNKTPITTEQVEVEAVSTAAEDVGVIDQYKHYVELLKDVERKLSIRVDALEQDVLEARMDGERFRKKNDVIMSYAEELRTHIRKELPPPPPPWPEGIL